ARAWPVRSPSAAPRRAAAAEWTPGRPRTTAEAARGTGTDREVARERGVGTLDAGHGIRGRATPRARAAPPRADGALLPHARLAVRGRGRGAGDAAARLEGARPVRGPLVRALVALPDRDQRLPRPA